MLKKLITISITAIVSLQAATTYDKSLTDGNDNLNYWSDTTNSSLTNHTLVGATEVFTIGSRENIPNVPTSSIKVSTNKLCSDDRKGLASCSKSDSLEPRYTDDGLATSGEVNLRTWYKATTPKSVNGVIDDPCVTLSNTGSVVNWAANFPSLRCERTITTYTNKVSSTIYTNKTGSVDVVNSVKSSQLICPINTSPMVDFFKKNCKADLRNVIIADFHVTAESVCKGPNIGCNQCIVTSFFQCDLWIGTQSIIKSCPSGYTLRADGQCEKSTLSCPSGYSDNGSNCQQTIQICPDVSWSDNVTNCKKNVPEYKLFSTF